MRCRGFTLSEMLFALALCALLLTMATSGFAGARARAAVRTAAGQTMAAMHLGRRLALARGQTVTICPSADGLECGFGGNRWMLFANDAAGPVSRLDETEEVLRQWQLPAGVTVTGTRGYAAFQPRPGAASTVTFSFCHESRPGELRQLIVSQTGRPRLATPEQPDGESHACP